MDAGRSVPWVWSVPQDAPPDDLGELDPERVERIVRRGLDETNDDPLDRAVDRRRDLHTGQWRRRASDENGGEKQRRGGH
jgi:hypothetical protein